MGLQQPNGRPLLIDGQHVNRMTEGIGEWLEPGLTDPIQFMIIETPSGSGRGFLLGLLQDDLLCRPCQTRTYLKTDRARAS